MSESWKTSSVPERTWPGEHLSYLRDACAAQNGKIFVADDDGVIVGHTCVWKSTTEDARHVYVPDSLHSAYVLDLHVSETARGKGIGRRLLEAAEAHARLIGEKVIMLHVLARNQAAADAYGAMGYREHSILLTKKL